MSVWTGISARLALVVGLATALTAGAALLPTGDDGAAAPPTGRVAWGSPAEAPDQLEAQVEQLQRHLAQQPADARGQAMLALALVERGRMTADPAHYRAATTAVRRSLAAQPDDNDLALAARAALLSAQHRFDSALSTAERALAVNPYSPTALAVRVDSLTELGRLDAALTAARRLDAVHPGLPAATRLAYQAELRGDRDRARRLFASALAHSVTDADRAFSEYHLGELARQDGRFGSAAGHYQAALAAVPGDPAAVAGRARLLAVTGRPDRAIVLLRGLVERRPLPEHVVALGELLELTGDALGASEQYAVARATAQLARAAGSRPDLELAWFEADHGDPATALAAARSEWRRRQAPLAADALAWALHSAGRDAAALPLARRSVREVTDARSLHHLGAIEASLGLDVAARRHLLAALRLDRGYPPWQAAQLQAVLADLGRSS